MAGGDRSVLWSGATLPGMRNRPGFAGLYTGEGLPVGCRFAWVALIFYFFLLLGRNHDYRLVPQRVIWIFINYNKDPCRTRSYAVSATVAFVCVDRNEIIT